jgi:2-hydroxychromene-2-carboxylate isomerase
VTNGTAGSLTAEAARVLDERNEWQRVLGLSGEKIIDIFIDMKSPHAYLAIRPTLELARDYRVTLNFLPYTLSYATLGLTSSVEPDMARRAPSPAADRKARMYYTAARQYARLQDLPFRSPHRLLDSELAHRAFLFAKAQRLEIPFVMHAYVHGWGSGWREYELESPEQLCSSLTAIGARTDGFETYIATGGAGEVALRESMARAEDTGCTGVPHYVLPADAAGRMLGLFGREHLALIRGKLGEEGLARHPHVQPEFSHAWQGPR